MTGKEYDSVNRLSAEKAVKKLVKRYHKMVFHVIEGITGNWHESQYLTENTFVYAFRGIDTAQAESGIHFDSKLWLMKVMHETVMLRSLNGSSHIPAYSEKEETTSDNNDPVKIAERKTVRIALAQIPETLREYLLLSVVAHLSPEEIADVLGINESAVKETLTMTENQFKEIYEREK